jgi:UDPglucose--hexose-1-phosphate uridylyltransferase
LTRGLPPRKGDCVSQNFPPVSADRPHRRFNPLNGKWVLVSPHRAKRPWLGQAEDDAAPLALSYDPQCYLCPGSARVVGVVNPDYAGAYVFDNDFPAVLAASGADAQAPDALFQSELTSGTCRVICFSADHSKTLPELNAAERRAIVECWITQTQDLGQSHAWVQVFENKGAVMGCSNPHPHGQVWATSHVPDEVLTEDARQRDYDAAHKSLMLLDLAEREAALGERVVVQNDHWIAIVPYWASWPFETLLLPRFRAARLPDLNDAQRDSLAAAVGELTARYDNLFACSFPYSMGWHGAPFTGGDCAHWQVHAHFYPPLLRSATVRKFMVGYEMMAEPQRDLTPEQAAKRLRAVSATHFRAA